MVNFAQNFTFQSLLFHPKVAESFILRAGERTLNELPERQPLIG